MRIGKIGILVFAAAMSVGMAGARERKISSSSHEAAKTEHVSGYTTKKGKHVKAYTRRPAGTVPADEKKHRKRN